MSRSIISKINVEQELLDTMNKKLQTQAKNCNHCSHQGVCSAFMMFKTNIEPAILQQDSTLKAENLAWICNIYQEKKRKDE